MLAYNFIYIMILLESSREDREVTIPPQEMACNCKLGNVQSLYPANVLVGAHRMHFAPTIQERR
jgi:hypothetical protein